MIIADKKEIAYTDITKFLKPDKTSADRVQLNSENRQCKELSMQKKLKDRAKNNPGTSPFESKPEIEHKDNIVKITQKIDPNMSIEGLNEIVSSGKILSYSIEGNELIIYGNTENAAEELKKLKVSAQTNKGGGIVNKLKEIFVPPDLDENCAPEYLRYRFWSLASSVCSGGIGFATAKVNLDAVKVAFSTTEKAALSGFINGLIWKFTAMGGSFLAKNGDIDPKKFMLMGNLIAVGNTLLTLGLLCTIPASMPVLTAVTAVTGAMASVLGSAAGVNIFNHMAKGPSKGLVASKNSNQDMLADACGMPVAMMLTRIAATMGINPFLFVVGVLGPLLAICTLKAASSVRMDTLNQGNIEKIADNFIQNGGIPEADNKGVWETFKSLFTENTGGTYSKRIEFPDSIKEVVGEENDGKDSRKLFSIFKDENYILNCKSKDKISIVFKNKANIDDIFKAYIHARLIEKGLESELFPELEKIYGSKASTALIELSYRSLPPNMRFSDELSAKGWNSSSAKLDMKKLNVDWTSLDEIATERIDIKQFIDLTKDPSKVKENYEQFLMQQKSMEAFI